MKLLLPSSIIALLSGKFILVLPHELDKKSPFQQDRKLNRYSPFTSNDALKTEVNNYCSNPNGYDTSVYGPIENWDVSQITNMRDLFYAKDCSPDISRWDVSSVNSLFNTFRASTFNADISCWDTSSVTDMYGIFRYNTRFNHNIGQWDVSNVGSWNDAFKYVAAGASSFRQNLGCWPDRFWATPEICNGGAWCGSKGQPCADIGPCDASAGGDPHIYAFGNIFFSWQGWCDVILIKTPQSHDDDKALLVNIRTKRVRKWSAINAVAIKVDQDVVEISGDDGKIFLNQQEVDTISSDLVSFSVTKSKSLKKKRNVLYHFDFGKKQQLQVEVEGRTKMLFITATGKYPPGTVGILGSPQMPGLFARDSTNMTGLDMNAFVESWQVRDDDPQLFKDLRAPQYPQKCEYFSSKASSRIHERRLKETKSVNLEMAHSACALHPPGQRRDWCIEDVINSQDANIAENSFYG